MDIREDRWLSERLARPVFTLGVDGGFDREAFERHLRDQELTSYQVKAPADDEALKDALIGAGFSAVSTTVTMRCDPRIVLAQAVATPPGIELRDAAITDAQRVGEIAASCFRFSRFHLDPAIPIELANAVKCEWARNCARGERGEQVLVAVEGGEPVAFLAVIAGEADGLGYRAIDLVGVDPEHQGRGIGQALVGRFAEQSVGRCDAIQAGTQMENMPAMALYEGLGFKAVGSTDDLHLHVGSIEAEDCR